MKQTIVTKVTVDVGDSDSPVQDAETTLTELLFELEEEGRIEEYRIQGPEHLWDSKSS